MYFRDITNMVTLLKHAGTEVAGLSDIELAEIESACLDGVPLPGAYREFMALMGRSAGRLLAGTDIFYPKVIEYQEELWDFVREDSMGALPPERSFIFGSHQGYQVYWMPLGAGEDPEVEEYQESDGVVRHWGSFTRFIEDEFSAIAGPQSR